MGRVLGIPVELNVSFVLILGLFTWLFYGQAIGIWEVTIGFGDLDAPAWARLALAVLLSVLFFAGVLVHELAHSYVALRQGHRVRSINLFIFGGVSQIEDMPEEPGEEFRMAVAGPLTSLVIGAALYGLHWSLAGSAGPLATVAGEALLVIVGTLAFYNVLLGLFNLIPAFPTDGGRILRSAMATRTDLLTATRWAANVGKGVAIAMAVLGLLGLNVWLILIAVFIYLGAGAEERMTRVTKALEGMRVGDLMETRVGRVEEDASMDRVVRGMMENRWDRTVVVRDGEPVGIVDADQLRNLDGGEELAGVRVGDVMMPVEDQLSPSGEAVDALKRIRSKGRGDLVVTDGGQAVGVLGMREILQTAKLRSWTGEGRGHV